MARVSRPATSNKIVTCNYNIHACTCQYVCWKLLSNQSFKGSYLEAEVVEEVMGWLG